MLEVFLMPTQSLAQKPFPETAELFLVDKKESTASPWTIWADEIIRNGYAIITINSSMQADFKEMQSLVGRISVGEKKDSVLLKEPMASIQWGTHTSSLSLTPICVKHSTIGVVLKTNMPNGNLAIAISMRLLLATKARLHTLGKIYSSQFVSNLDILTI